MNDLHRKYRPNQRTTLLMVAMLAIAACTGSVAPASTVPATDLGGSPTASAAADEGLLTTLRTRGVIRISNTQAAPPWDYMDANTQLVGYNVDVGNEIGARLGIAKVEFVAGSYATFIEGLKADKYDLVISGQTPTDERRKVVDFSCTYQLSASAIFVNESNTTIVSEADLEGKRIAVAAGTTEEENARKIPGATILVFPNYLLSLTDVGLGRADAVIGSRYVGAFLAKENGLKVKPVTTAGVEANAISIRKGEAPLVAAVNKALADMIADGTLSSISKKWLGGLDIVEDIKQLPAC